MVSLGSFRDSISNSFFDVLGVDAFFLILIYIHMDKKNADSVLSYFIIPFIMTGFSTGSFENVYAFKKRSLAASFFFESLA